MIKTYVGVRYPGGLAVTVNGQPLKHIVIHSPTGFEAGYCGSGPADLALSILFDHFEPKPTLDEIRKDPTLCWKLYQYFKEDVIATLPTAGWAVDTLDIDQWLMKRADLYAKAKSPVEEHQRWKDEIAKLEEQEGVQ